MEDLVDRNSTTKSKVNAVLVAKSLYLFDNTDKFRMFLYKVVTHKFFDPVSLVLIVISSITLAIDNPLDDPNG